MHILIADNHALFCDVLSRFLKTACEDAMIECVANYDALADYVDRYPALDLILMDLALPGTGGDNPLSAVFERLDPIPVAVLSSPMNESDQERIFDMGAMGYFPKTLSGKVLLQGIHQIIAGKIFTPPQENLLPQNYMVMAEGTGINAAGMQQYHLTGREREVLNYLLKGASNKDIARHLDLQVVTVKLHVRGICRKMGAKNRTQAALLAHEMSISIPQQKSF